MQTKILKNRPTLWGVGEKKIGGLKILIVGGLKFLIVKNDGAKILLRTVESTKF